MRNVGAADDGAEVHRAQNFAQPLRRDAKPQRACSLVLNRRPLSHGDIQQQIVKDCVVRIVQISTRLDVVGDRHADFPCPDLASVTPHV
jgi:hypothetical protein